MKRSSFFLFFFALFFSVLPLGATEYSHDYIVKKIYPMGEKIFKKKCSDVDVTAFDSYVALQTYIDTKSSCKKLAKRYREAVGLYLWGSQRVKKHNGPMPSLTVTHTQKCPVCGMFLYKYPRWVSMIEYKDEKRFYFDGMKDLMKYYFEHPQSIEGIYTRDYYTQKVINVKDAYFVIGSDVYGPMGDEFIPLQTKKEAERFLLDHRGKKILRFDAIDIKTLQALDE